MSSRCSSAGDSSASSDGLNATPPSNGWQTSIEILGKLPRDEQKVRINFVSPGYFPVLRIPLAQGRIWDESENHNAAHVAVINQTMARLYFPEGDAIGHSMRVPDMKDEPPIDSNGIKQYQNKYSSASLLMKDCHMQLSGPWPPYHFVHRLTHHTSAAVARQQRAAFGASCRIRLKRNLQTEKPGRPRTTGAFIEGSKGRCSDAASRAPLVL